jgi:hypothetical protein
MIRGVAGSVMIKVISEFDLCMYITYFSLEDCSVISIKTQMADIGDDDSMPIPCLTATKSTTPYT